jgi:hypothetical protein
MGDEPATRGSSHDLLLALEARRLLTLHEALKQIGDLGEITWFVVDLEGSLGLFCGCETVGRPLVEIRLAWAARNGVRPSMCFPLDGSGALVVVEQLAPNLVGAVQRRLLGDVAIIIVDQNDEAALAWLHELEPLPGVT